MPTLAAIRWARERDFEAATESLARSGCMRSFAAFMFSAISLRTRVNGTTSSRGPPDGAPRVKSDDERRHEAIELIVGTVEALASERGGDDKVWGSMVKQALKRVRPGFAESYYGFRSFNAMLEAARDAGALSLERDEKSGGYAVRVAAHDD